VDIYDSNTRPADSVNACFMFYLLVCINLFEKTEIVLLSSKLLSFGASYLLIGHQRLVSNLSKTCF